MSINFFHQSPIPQDQSPPSSPQESEAPKQNGESRVEMLMDALIGLIIDVPITYVYVSYF